MSVTTWVRRKQYPEGERFGIGFHLSMPGWGGGTWDRALTVLLVVSVLGAMAAAGYAIATPKDGEKFTEFYILGAYGEAADYPQSVTVGQEIEVTVGIVNQEDKETSYRIEVKIEEELNNTIGPLILQPGEKYENVVSKRGKLNTTEGRR